MRIIGATRQSHLVEYRVNDGLATDSAFVVMDSGASRFVVGSHHDGQYVSFSEAMRDDDGHVGAYVVKPETDRERFLELEELFCSSDGFGDGDVPVQHVDLR